MDKKLDNVVFVVGCAIKYLKIKITETTIKKELLSHLNYPSLKSICDTFEKWNIENYSTKVEPKKIELIELPFIVHLNLDGGQFAFVEKNSRGFVTYHLFDKIVISEDFGKFSKKISGIVIIFQTRSHLRISRKVIGHFTLLNNNCNRIE